MRLRAWLVPAFLLASLLASVTVPSVGAVAGNFGNYGSRVTTSSGDFAAQLAALPAAQTPCLVREEAGVANTASDDNYYIHFTAAGCAALGKLVADVVVAGTSVGTLVTSASGTYTAAVNAAAVSIRYLEVDGKPGFSDLDWAYIDADQSGTLTVGDIRLFTPTSAGVTPPSPRYVSANEADVQAAASATEDTLPTTITFQAGALALLTFDANTDGSWGSGDTLVADDGVNARFLSLGDVFVSSSGGRSHGTLAAASSAGSIPILLPVTNAFLATTTNACTAPLNGDLYIHFGGFAGAAGTHIQPGDLVLRKGGDTSTGGATGFMGRVTTASTGAGSAIQASTALTAAHFFYVNNPATPSGFGPSDWLYLDVTGICGGAAGFSAGDIRLTASNGGASFGAGSMVVTGNSDLTSYGASTLNPDSDGANPWYFLHRNVDQSLGRPLNALTNAKFSDADNDDIWDPATEEVYISAGTVVAVGDVRLAPGDSGHAGSTSAATTLVALGNSDVGNAIEANTDFKVFGDDTAFTAGAGEVVVYSADSWMTPAFDLAVIPVGAIASGSALAALQAAYFGAVGASDQFVLQWARTGQTTMLPIHQSGDVILTASPTFVTATSADHVPTLTAIPAGALVRFDRTDGSPSEDTYYLKTGAAAPPLQTGVTIRASPHDSSRAAGTILTSADTSELTAGASVAPSATTFENAVRFIDIGPAGIDPTDPVYVDLPVDIGGQNAGTFGFFDIRATAATLNGVTYTAGSLVQPSDQDRTGFGTAWGAYAGGNAHRLYFFDENRDGLYNSDDVMYLVHTVAAPASFVVPDLLSIHAQGPGGATSNTAPPVTGGGGGVVTTTSTTGTPSSTSGTPTSDSDTSTTATDTGSDTGSVSPGDLAAANQAIRSSLTVTRSGDDNVLNWDSQPGVDGYQVFSSNSPFVLLTTLIGQATSSFTDTDAEADTVYVVTAYTDGNELTADDVNNGDVPGYTGVPSGEAPAEAEHGKGGKGFIPAPGFALVTVALAALVLTLRRRL